MSAVAPSLQMLEGVEMGGGSSNSGGSGSNVGGVLGPPSVSLSDSWVVLTPKLTPRKLHNQIPPIREFSIPPTCPKSHKTG
ncbi:unnamed protein product [Prunus armeniaca]|uniref:Uncharacterized protein n=1 Tax=Prunus armeniaca TaxID=36596 RepID=A0A6J5UA78_PRUAR|nr:unnamed protein product [Prunus armeniaca]